MLRCIIVRLNLTVKSEQDTKIQTSLTTVSTTLRNAMPDFFTGLFALHGFAGKRRHGFLHASFRPRAQLILALAE